MLHYQMSADSRFNESQAALNCRTGRFNEEQILQSHGRRERDLAGEFSDGLNSTERIDLPL